MPCFGEASRGGPCSFFGPPSTSGGRGDSPTARQPGTLHCKLVCFTQDGVVHIIYSTGATRTPNTRQHGRSPYLWGALAEGGPCGWPSLGPNCLPLPSPGLHSPRTLLALRWSSGRSSVGPAPVFWGGFPVSGLPALLLVGLLPFATPFGSPLLWWALSPCAGGGPRSLVHPSQLAPPSGPSLAFGCFWVLPGPSGLPPSPRPRSPLPSGFVGPPVVLRSVLGGARRPCVGEAVRSLACPPSSCLGTSPFPLPLGTPCFRGPSPFVRVVVPVRWFTPPGWLLQARLTPCEPPWTSPPLMVLEWDPGLPSPL